MQNPQKKSYKTFYEKPKGHTSNSYDYDSFEQSSYQNSYYNNSNKAYGYSKSKKYYQEYTTYQPVKSYTAKTNKVEEHASEHPAPNVREHGDQEKFNDEKHTGAPKYGPGESEYQSNKGNQKSKVKGEKKPEKQLYSARKKHGETGNTETLAQGEENNKSKETVAQQTEKKEEKEGPLSEEDKSFLSNVSTETSDKAKVNEEENSHKESPSISGIRPMVKPPHRILFQGVVKSERYIQKVDVYEDEEDFEALVDRLCEIHDFVGRDALYFKINFLKMIYDTLLDKSRVEAALSRNINLNARVILCENGLQEVDESVRPYLEFCGSNTLYLQR